MSALSLPSLSDIETGPFEFEPLHGADIDYENLLGRWFHVVSLATLLDFVWRGYRSLRLVIKYGGRGAVAVDPLDLRIDNPTAVGSCASIIASPRSSA